MRDKRGYVPLPEVNEKSEIISIGELGLPTGFDLERLEIHLPRAERTTKFGDIGQLSIVGFKGESTEYGYGVGGISSDGIGTATGSVAVTKARVVETETEGGDEFINGYRWNRATVKINNTEIEEKIKSEGDKWDLGVFDAQARAKHMDKSLRSGIREAAHDSIFGEPGIPGRLPRSIGFKSFDILVAWGCLLNFMDAPSIRDAFILNTVITVADIPLGDFLLRKLYERRGYGPLPQRQVSLGSKVHYDRFMAAQALSAVPKLVRSK